MKPGALSREASMQGISPQWFLHFPTFDCRLSAKASVVKQMTGLQQSCHLLTVPMPATWE